MSLSLGGCKGQQAKTSDKTSQPGKEPAAPTEAPSKAKPAVLVGSVRIADGQELPFYTHEQMEHEVLAHAKGGSIPDVCSPPKLEDRQPVSLTPEGKLVGVMLAASEFSQYRDPTPAKVFNIGIKDCRLQPKIIVARIGDSLHITNESDFPMMPSLGQETYNQTLTNGQSRDIKLDIGGVKILTCGFSGQCGRTDVIVLGHSQGTITDDKGGFRLEDFPADETVRINAWHPLFHETYQEVRVAAGEEKRIELVLTPKAPPKPREPAEPVPGIISPD